jgi:hypothetical protein
VESTPKPKRSKEEIAAAKAEAEAKRVQRHADMLAKCHREYGAACISACEKACARRVRDAGISKARVARAKAKAEARGAGIQQMEVRDKARADADAARYVIERRPAAPSKQFSKAAQAREAWRVAVLFILGLSKEEIATEMYGYPTIRVGAINKVMTKGNLVAIRNERPVDHLLELDRQSPHGMAGMVMSDAFRFNKRLLAAIEHRRGIVPEQQLREEGDRAFKRLVNQSTSALHIAARGGRIREWNLLAGIELQSIQGSSPAGRLDSIDYSRDNVDGGKGSTDGRVLAAIDVAETMDSARRTVLKTFEEDATGPWRWALIDHVVLKDRPLDTYPLPAGMTQRADEFLNDALEPLSFLFRLAPSGIRLKTGQSQAGLLLSAIKANREARLAEGTLASAVSPAMRAAGESSEERRRRLFGR